MATARTRTLRLVEPEEAAPLPGPITLDLSGDGVEGSSTLQDGVLKTDNPDGSATIDFNPDVSDPSSDPSKPEKFYANLASKIDDSKLSQIASTLLDGIQRDEDSRREWLDTRARGIQLLGLRLEDPKADVAMGSAPLEGMSTVRHPLLLESTVQFQATAGGELLPATGPVKVRNDTPPRPATPPQPPPMPPPPPPQQPQAMGAPPVPMGPPMGPGDMGPQQPPPGTPPQGVPPMMPPGMGHNGGPPMAPPVPQTPLFDQDVLAEALEKDMNHYLTAVATEYYPDTDRMLFYIGFGGDGFKKVYNCPLRRRPVSESVDAENLIVSNAATELKNCGRVTHLIKMRKSVIRRMQILGAYRDVDLSPPAPPNPNPVDKAKEELSGQKTLAQRPEDYDYTIYETYCELDLDEFAPRHFKGKGLALPYRVTIEKDSRQVLSIVRNWNEDDKECLAKQFFVQFPFIRALGFYGIGFIHLVGNTTTALTGAWREMLDAGMFANFPAFLYLKQLGRQYTNQFRAGPGQGIGIDGIGDIRQQVMPLPYKEPGPAFTAFIKEIEEGGRRLAAVAQVNVGEGKQDAPVGTTLALIEQATKLINSVHKRLHAAQAEEFKLLKERFQEDPEAFWRHNKNPTMPWKKEQFLAALNNSELVPVADPNNPTSLHRIAKATAIKSLQAASPRLYDGKAVDERIFRIVGIDAEGLFLPQPAPEPPDPRLIAIQQKAQGTQMQAQLQHQDAMLKAKIDMLKLSDKAQDRQSRERLEMLHIQRENIRLQEEQIIHQHEQAREDRRAAVEVHNENMRTRADLHHEAIKTQAELAADRERSVAELHADQISRAHEIESDRRSSAHDHENEQRKHEANMERDRQKHEQKMEHDRQLHEQKLAHAKALAKVAKKSKPKKSGGKE